MAVPCKTCSQPVHEHAVVCPHCGDESGVPSDPIAAAQVARMHKLPPEQPLEVHTSSPIVDVVERVLELIAWRSDAADAESLPRAIARERPPTAREPERAPEPAPAPSETPRILK